MATGPEHYREAEELLDRSKAERTELPRRVLASQWARAGAYQGRYQVRLGAKHGIVRVFIKDLDKENEPDWRSA